MLHNIITGVLLFTLLFTSNCFGKFTLLQKVHGINAQINVGEGKVNGAFKSFFMILMAIPIYPGAIVLDVVFLNLVEFWTDKNPLGGESNAKTEAETLEDGTKISKTYNGNELTISITKDNRSHSFIALRDEPGKLFVKKDNKLEEIPIETLQFGSLLLVSINGKNQILKIDSIENTSSF
ncbi:MAG: DUF3332 family protein [Spirochaetia bacterium]|nr:DUF3332 family protein [Spirochaetia bacterium]